MDPSETQVDPIAAHWNPFREQELALPPSFRQAAIGADDAMPGQVIVMCRREHMPDVSGSEWVDVAVGSDEALRDGPDLLEDVVAPTGPQATGR